LRLHLPTRPVECLWRLRAVAASALALVRQDVATGCRGAMSPFQFLADLRQQLTLVLGDRPESEETARSGRDSRAVGEQVALARFSFRRGERVEDGADRSERFLEELAGWTLRQPCGQLTVGGRSGLDAPRPRRLNDQVALALRYAATSGTR
jgi:hypothetical protein